MNINSSTSAPLTSYLQQSSQTQQARKTAESSAVSKAADAVDTSGLRVGDLERIQSYVNQLKEMPSVREEKVAQAKAALEAGDYDKGVVIDKVAQRMLEEL